VKIDHTDVHASSSRSFSECSYLYHQASPSNTDNTVQFRDLVIAQGKYPWSVTPSVVPGSDGAGTVLAIGRNVTRFQPGDKVVTMLNQKHINGSLTPEMLDFGTGASVDGTFRKIGAFDEQGLVRMPEGLTFMEAATLSCAGVTAWNALFGLEGRKVGKDSWVLTQGTGEHLFFLRA
jgi:NADPH:quinone reductase-like Zn-dependent oxidoreductase